MPAVGFDAMRTLSKTIVALGLVALMAGPALAQQGRGGVIPSSPPILRGLGAGCGEPRDRGQ